MIALHPSAKARINRSRPSDSAGTATARTSSTWGTSPSSERPIPIAIIASIETRKTYVGIAKTVPLSRIPRRLTTMTATIDAAARGTRRSPETCGKADVIAATPAATLTDTVRT